MILKGKAKEDFEKWLTKGMSIFAHDMEIEFFNKKSDIEKNAIIIEWFDSVGIYISIVNEFDNKFRWVIADDIDIIDASDLYLNESRQEATQQAIIKANEIYNNK